MPVEQVIEEKKVRLAKRAREARTNFERGSAKMGTLKSFIIPSFLFYSDY